MNESNGKANSLKFFQPIKKHNIDTSSDWVENIVFDLIDHCNLVCPSCYHGINGGTKKKMSLDACRLVLDHCTKFFSPKSIHPFNWSEPFLCEELDQFIKLFSNYALKLHLSSNMNITLPDSSIELLLQNTHQMIFSVSGLDQEVYKKYHRGGKVSKVLSNIQKFVDIRNNINSACQLVWSFGLNKHNHSQVERIKDYCQKNNIAFALNRYYVTDAEDVNRIFEGEEIQHQIYNNFYDSSVELRKEVLDSLTPRNCKLISRDIVVDCDGNLMLCTATKISTNIHISEITSVNMLIDARLENRFCNQCWDRGLPGYFFMER